MRVQWGQSQAPLSGLEPAPTRKEKGGWRVSGDKSAGEEQAGFEQIKMLLSTAHLSPQEVGPDGKHKQSSGPKGSLQKQMEDQPPVGSEGEDALEAKPSAQGALSQQGPLRREPEGAGLLTAAQLGLLEAAQGLGVQGAGVGTERALRQLHGAIPGPGQQPAQAAVTRQELGAQVPAGGWRGHRVEQRERGLPGVGMEPQGETEAGEGREGKIVHVCPDATMASTASTGRRVWWSFSHRLPHLLRRLATWARCLCVSLLGSGRKQGLTAGAGILTQP